MKTLLNAIIKYLDKDLNKLGELNKLLSEEITLLEKAKNEQKEDDKLVSLEEKIKRKINEKEKRIEDYMFAYQTAKEMFLAFYKERIIKCYNIYEMLTKLDEKSKSFGLVQYSEVLENRGYDMYFDGYHNSKERLFFNYVNQRIVEEEKVVINSTFYLSYDKENNDLTLNIMSKNEYNCDNKLTLIMKDYFTITAMVDAFEKFEERVNDLIETILEEE